MTAAPHEPRNGVVQGRSEAVTEQCLRCGASLEWRHGTFQCPRCRFKVGCCEGDTGDCRDPG